jgi:hypothetical protein
LIGRLAIMRALYYVGRMLQLAGMWLLLVDIVTAGPLGPNPRLFGVGVAVFVFGWLIVRRRGR